MKDQNLLSRIASKLFGRACDPFSPEELIGEVATVTGRIDNLGGRGEVTLDGQAWAARSVTEEECFEEGDRVRIVAVEGAKMICRAK